MDIKRHIENLRTGGELLEIESAVDGRLELAALTDRMCKTAGPALLFTQVKGSRLALATNLFGSDRRMATALGQESLASFGSWLTQSLVRAKGMSSAERLPRLLQAVETDFQPSARVYQKASLNLLPQLRYWPREQRSFLTLAVVISRGPASTAQNYGLYRVGIAGDKQLTLNLLPGSGARQHLEEWRAAGGVMPVAILLGADPALLLAAAAKLPENCPEESFSALLSQTVFQYCRCQTVPLDCPTSGQLVIEGWVDVVSTLNEGPFGCYTGDYGGSNVCPLVEVSALSMVTDPVIPLTLAGPLPMEDCWIARANLELSRARLAIDLPELNSIEMPLEAAFHGLYFVRSDNPSATVDELVCWLGQLGYLGNLKMVILLRDSDDGVSESGWRELFKKTPAGQIWLDPTADLTALLNGHPAKLQHDPALLESLLPRLRANAPELMLSPKSKISND